jgi:putative MATE family efflux protein
MNKENERAKLLSEESIGKLLLQFSVPAIIGMLVNALYNIVDRIFIGWGVNELAIGGLYVGMPITLVLMAFSMLIGIGGNTLVSIRLGQNRKEDAERITGNSITLLLIISIFISIVGLIFLDPLLKSFGASANNLGYAKDYLRIILYGAPLQALGFGMNNFIRGEGSPKIAMITMLIGAFLNTVLDPIFIFGFGMGVKGAALATIISQAVSAIWVMKFFFSGNSILRIKKEYLKLQSSIVKEIVSLGFAPFSMQLAASLVTILLNTSLQKYGGDLATSSMGIIQSISMLILMPMFGINQGAQPIIGFNYGAKNYDRVKETLKYAVFSAVGFGILGFILTQTFPVQLFKLFIGSEGSLNEITKIGVPGLRMYLFMLPIIGFQVVCSNYFQAIGKPKHAAFLSLSRQVLVIIPVLVFLPRFYQLTGV